MNQQPTASTILVVDDNEQNRALAQAALEDEGYNVVLAASGGEALRIFAERQIDCVLLDIRMPGLDGPTTCERLREMPEGRDVPIVFLTAQRDVDAFDRAQRAGGDDFLTKPVQPTELILRVAAALKLRQMKEELREHYATVRKQRDDLMRLQLQKERLSQFIVHDLKNPVSNLDLSAQMLLRDPQLSPRARASVQRMRLDARTLLNMLLNLLDISRSDEGELVLRKEPIVLGELIEQVIQDQALKASAAKLTCVSDCQGLSIDGDASLLRRVLDNLLENAIRHAPEETQIHVSARDAVDAVEIRVSDQGPGISPEVRNKIFEPFVQLENGERVVTRTGRGLGLAFCKVAVEAHGGRIWIDDANPGAAFCFTLRKPAA